jgi:predicted nucleic acid-binding Zn ribbon protein
MSLPPKEATCDCGHTITLEKQYEWCEKCMHKIFYHQKDKRRDKINTYYIYAVIVAVILFLGFVFTELIAVPLLMIKGGS